MVLNTGEEDVPKWDGQEETWHDYVRDVELLYFSTPEKHRALLGAKLARNLTGSARLALTGLKAKTFAGDRGLECLLEALGDRIGPLPVPSFANRLDDFMFRLRRNAGESINDWGLRFQESYRLLCIALDRVKGRDVQIADFGLELTVQPESGIPNAPQIAIDLEVIDLLDDFVKPQSGHRPQVTNITSTLANESTTIPHISKLSTIVASNCEASSISSGPPVQEYVPTDFLPTEVRGWLLLKNAKLPDQAWTTVIASTQGNLAFDVVWKALRQQYPMCNLPHMDKTSDAPMVHASESQFESTHLCSVSQVWEAHNDTRPSVQQSTGRENRGVHVETNGFLFSHEFSSSFSQATEHDKSHPTENSSVMFSQASSRTGGDVKFCNLQDLKRIKSGRNILRNAQTIVVGNEDVENPFEHDITLKEFFSFSCKVRSEKTILQRVYHQLHFCDEVFEPIINGEPNTNGILVKRHQPNVTNTHCLKERGIQNAQRQGQTKGLGNTDGETHRVRFKNDLYRDSKPDPVVDQYFWLDLKSERDIYQNTPKIGCNPRDEPNPVLRVMHLDKNGSDPLWGFLSRTTSSFWVLPEPTLIPYVAPERVDEEDSDENSDTETDEDVLLENGPAWRQKPIQNHDVMETPSQPQDSNDKGKYVCTLSDETTHRLNEPTKQMILQACQKSDLNFEHMWSTVTKGDRFDFAEICCSPNSRLTAECVRKGGKGYRVNLANGYDLSTRHGVCKAIQWIREWRPIESWISLPCGPWSSMQNMNQRDPEQIARLAKKRKDSKRMIRLMVEIVRALIEVGSKPVFEWPLRCSGWTLPELKPILDALPYKCRVDGCQFGMKTVDTDELILKSWRLQCATIEQATRVAKVCSHDHTHAPIEGSLRVNATSYYPVPMVRKWVCDMFKHRPCHGIRNALLTSDAAQDVDVFAVLPKGDLSEGKNKGLLDRIDAMISKIHRNAAHCNPRTLARVLKEDNAPDWVVQRALDFKCEFCDRHKQPEVKPPVSLNYETHLWHSVGIDNAEIEIQGKTVTFMLLEEEACGFCVPKVLFERSTGEHKNPTAQEVTDAFADTWLAHYPKPVRVKTDPEGAFQSTEFRDFLAMNDIRYDPTAGDAHFQLGRVERAVQTIKRISQKLAQEFPDANGIQVLAAACSAHNELRRIKGYSPNQWVFGHAKPGWDDVLKRPGETYERIMELRISAQTHFLRHRAHEKVQSALRARTRKLSVYEKGQTVMIWRTGKGTKTKPGKDGKWLGPGIVLVHQRNPNGTFGKIVWVSLGGKLYRVAPEHLRSTTEREGLIFEANYPRLSLCPKDILQKGEFEDLTGQPNPADEDYDMADRVLVPEHMQVEVPPQTPTEETPQVNTRKRYKQSPTQDATPGESSSASSSKHRKVVELVYLMDKHDVNKFAKSPQKFISQRNTKRAVEVNIRDLHGQELEEMEEAMAKELAEWLQEEALRTLTQEELLHVDPMRTLKMRWVLTYKPDSSHPKGKKAKARIVILGYQHPEVEELETASPTLGRTGKHLVLQWAAINKATVESADAKSAFLQGDGKELDEREPIYVKAIAEVSHALNVPIGTAVKIAKAVYGLGNAPRSWFFSVHRSLTEIGGEQLRTEPCIWRFRDTNGIVIGVVAAYVDDFIIAGNHRNKDFLAIRSKIKNLYRWGNWEKGSFTMCGVKITQRMDFSFVLDQSKYVHEGLQLINVPKGPDRPVNDRELSQLRAVLGALQWKASQTGPHISATLNALQSQVTKATLKTLKEANDLIKVAKLHDYPVTIHHHNYVSWNELCSINWCDAAQGDRPDGGSTGGQVHGLAVQSDIMNGVWTPVSLVGWNTSRLPRVARSSLAAEIQSMCTGEDESYLIRHMWSELNGFISESTEDVVNQTPCVLVTDAKALYDASMSETSALGLKERRSGIELLGLKENMARNKITLRWVNSGAMLADPMTKGKMRHMMERFLKDPQWKIVDDPAFESFKKRVLKGQDALDYIYSVVTR